MSKANRFSRCIDSILVPTFVSKHVAPRLKGRFLALNDAMRSLAGVVCPLTLGLLWEAEGVSAVLLALLALPVLGTLAYLGLLALHGAARKPASASVPASVPASVQAEP